MTTHSADAHRFSADTDKTFRPPAPLQAPAFETVAGTRFHSLRDCPHLQADDLAPVTETIVEDVSGGRSECQTCAKRRLKREYELAFDAQFTDAILEGRKYCTLRYGLDAPITPGGTLVLVNADARKPFARATVTRVVETSLELVVGRESGLEGHQDYATVDEAIGSLTAYYPDADLDRETWLTAVSWDDLEPLLTNRKD